MNSDNIILRETDHDPLVNKGDFITSEEFDSNFIAIYDDLVSLCQTLGVDAYDSGTTYDDTSNPFATYGDRLYQWINTSSGSNVTPGTEAAEGYWLEAFPTILAHKKNSDTILAEGTANEVTAADIRAFIDAGLTSTTNLGISTKTSTSFVLTSSTGADVTIPEANEEEAGLLSATDKAVLNQTSGVNTGDQTLEDLGAEATANKATDFTTINHTLFPTVEATETRIIEKVDALKATPPASLDTLQKIAAAIDNDPTFEATIRAEIATAINSMTLNCKNSSGGTIYKGTLVYISSVSGGVPVISRAKADDASTSDKTIGVVMADITNGAKGDVLTEGTLTALDTRSGVTHPFTTDTLSVGDLLYLSASNPGYITNVKPTQPNHIIRIGTVLATGSGSGEIYFQIDKGGHLTDLHDVLISAPSNNEVAAYETASGLWKNKTIATLLGFTPEDVSNKQTDLTASATKYPTVNAVNTGLSSKQDTLISATNIKTINGSSILGAGDLSIGDITIGTTPITGGADNRILFQNSGKVQESVGFTYTSSGNGSSTITGLTNAGGGGVVNAPLLTLSQQLWLYSDSIKIFRAYESSVANSFSIAISKRSGYNETTFYSGGNGTGVNTESAFMSVIGDNTSTNGGVVFPKNYVHIGNHTNGAKLDVKAQGALSTDIVQRWRNSSDSADLGKVTGDGNVTFFADMTSNRFLFGDAFLLSGGANVARYAGTASIKHRFTNDGTTAYFEIDPANGLISANDGMNYLFGTSTGSKIGTANNQKLSFWNATPIVQPTTAIAAATFIANTSANFMYEESTFDGYTLKQIVKALRNAGLLA